MKIFSSEQIREIDRLTIEHEPIASIDLMERAAQACAGWLLRLLPGHRKLHILCGMGNNGGDGLAIARILHQAGHAIEVYVVAHQSQGSPDFTTNSKRLEELGQILNFIRSAKDVPAFDTGDLVVDAILGTGMNKPLRGVIADVVRKVNKRNAEVISIDIPTGLFADDNRNNRMDLVLKARHTLSFQFPKLAFFTAAGGPCMGDFHILEIGLNSKAIEKTESRYYYTRTEDILPERRKRDAFSHKGDYGRALIVAGSEGMMGAAVLAARAALRIGAGLVTTHIPRVGLHVIQCTVPEAVCSPDVETEQVTKVDIPDKTTAVGIGPGLRQSPQTAQALEALLQGLRLPVVIDADALNMLAESKKWNLVPANAILTPHPGELARMLGRETHPDESVQEASQWAVEHSVILVLKGRYTAVCLPNGEIHFNSSGHPAMAKGGSGDVLTGILTGLLAQGYEPGKAALLGVFLHGRAGESAARERGEHAVIASDMVSKL